MPSAAFSSKPDVVVVGAGIVGSALAYSLGELLQPGGVRALAKMGIVDTLEDIDAVPVEGYHVFYGPRSVPIPYPQEKSDEAGRGVVSKSGKVEGRSFHHGKFVQSLRKKALHQPNVTPYEATVRDLLKDDEGRVVGISATWKKAPEGQAEAFELRAPLTIVVDGCFSKFRRTHGSSIQPVVRSNFVGLELHDAPLPAPHHGHVVLSKNGPVLLYQIGTHTTRILIDVAGEKLPSVAKGDLQKHVNENVIPQLPEQLRQCVATEMAKGQRLRSMPNSFLPPSMQGQSEHAKGVIVVGDAMNMRHPLTGGGMTVGLWDAVHLTEALGGSDWAPLSGSKPSRTPLDLSSWSHVSPALRSWHWNRKGLSSVINILAQALYSLFGADDENLEVLREGCFKYFEMGGECVNGPVSLLSGLAPRPMLLVGHFFAVALYSIYALFVHPRFYPAEQRTRKPSPLEYPALVWRSIMVFYTACIVLLPVVFTEMKSNIPRLSPTSSASSTAGARGKKGSTGGLVTDNFALVSASILLIGTAMLWGQAKDPAAAKTLTNWLVIPKVAARSS